MLDLFFRKYVWVVNALLLFAAAWLSAKTVNTVVGAAIRPTPQIDLRAAPPTPARPVAPAQVEPDKIYALIGQKPPAPAPAESAEAAPPPPRTCDDAKAAPVKATLRAQLVAGVIAEKPQWSIASITDLASRETRIYGVGDSFQGAKILAIGRMKEPHDITGQGYKMVAVVCHDGRKEFIDFEPGEAAAPAFQAATAPTPGAAAAALPPDGVKTVAENRYDVKRSVLDQSLSNMSSLATQARMVPNFKNGVANGFKLFSIQPNSLYASVGIENGDVVTKINGYEINSPDKALEVYQKLKEASHISLELERNGQPIRKEYNVTGP
ncbi:hypothetical protein AMPC_20910 [Anaeromyxobacter paludicola]|uniref:General secretion pathway protein C n=2 Tax=Anaeromyxobacter paludicola TaxID=2918171 RepID=A0ABN6N745_9BACT|nr:hypothetical protein AMPC_20910 [Anaeromyxobacter paludicola]